MNKRATKNLGVYVLLLASWAGQADACRCLQRDLADYFSLAQTVMLVEILEVEQVEHSSFQPLGRHLSAQFEVLETYKHSGPPLTRIKTAASSATCGLSGLAPGVRLWVFTYPQVRDQADAGWIDTCSGSRPANAGFNNLPADQVAPKLRALSEKRAVDRIF